MGFLRKLRGIVVTALMWAVVWVPVSLIPLGLGSLFGASLPPRLFVAFAISQAVMGAICGATFAFVLAIAGRRKTVDTLSLPWIAACGAVGAVLLPVIGRAVFVGTSDVSFPLVAMASTVVTNGLLGAGLAAATLSIARRAPALPAGSDEPEPAIGAGAV